MKNNWQTKKLGDLCEATKTVSPRSIFPQEFTYIDISSIDSSSRKIVNPKILSVDDAPSRARQLLQTNDILFAITRPYLKNIAFVSPEFNKAIASTGFCVIRPNTKLVNPDFLFLLVNSDEFIDQVVAKQKGATYPAVKDSDIFEIEIPLPPLDEQKKIVKMLDEKMGKIGEAKRLRAEALADTEKILPQTLNEIFEEGKKNGWEEKELGDVLEKIVGGGTPSKAIPVYWNGEIPWASVKDLKDGEYVLKKTRDFITKEGLENSSAKLVPKGTVIISTRMGLGRVAKTNIDMAINQDLKALFPKKEIDTDFLIWFLLNKAQEIISAGTGATVSGIRLEFLRKIKTPLPTLAEQQKIVAKLDALSEKVRTLRDLQTVQLADLKSLERAYLREAFGGV